MKRIARAAALIVAAGWIAALSPAGHYVVLFGLGEAELDEAGQAVIDQALDDLAKKVSAYHVSVTGHADRSGPEDYNEKLSWKRAEAVRDALIAGGIDPNAITISGRGEIEPRVPTPDGVEEQANRRAEIWPQ